MTFSSAWRMLMRDRVTIKRNVTTVSGTGSSRFNWDLVVADNIQCSVQDSGGRMRQAEFGQDGSRLVRLVFGPETDVQQNDLVVRARDGMSYKITHAQMASGGHHILAVGQQWVLGGQG